MEKIVSDEGKSGEEDEEMTRKRSVEVFKELVEALLCASMPGTRWG